jgi:ATP/maltotriose-dependent transcriptional regulator MalT
MTDDIVSKLQDDIVTRLRRAHVSGMEWFSSQGEHPTSTIHAEAADEIERLRAEVAYWKTPCPRCDYEEEN